MLQTLLVSDRREQAPGKQQRLVALPDQHGAQAQHQRQCEADFHKATSFYFRRSAYHADYHTSVKTIITTHSPSCNLTIVLLRHPQPLLPAVGICYGRLDLELRPGWQPQVDALALPPTHDALVWTSPSLRCKAPANRLADRLGLGIRSDERLRELDFGAWEGMPWDQVPRTDLDLWATDLLAFAPPGGESGQALVERVGQFHAMLRSRARPAIVVSHGGPLRVLSSLLRGAPVDLAAAAMGFLDSEMLAMAAP